MFCPRTGRLEALSKATTQMDDASAQPTQPIAVIVETAIKPSDVRRQFEERARAQDERRGKGAQSAEWLLQQVS